MSGKIFFSLFSLLLCLGFFLSLLFSKQSTSIDSKTNQIFLETSQKCAQNNERTKYIVCYKKNLESGVLTYGLKPMMSQLENRYLHSVDFDSGGINQCHDVAHAIGQTAGANSKDLNNTILECPNICTSGCFHGVVEGAISTGYKILENIGNLCQNKINGVDASTNTDCYHGLGHGVASLSGFDLQQSLKYCDLISGIDGQRSCGAGVIMELYEPSSFDHAILQFPDDIASFCATLWGTYEETCYVTAGTHTYTKNTSESESIKACVSVPDEYISDCISALGQNMFFVYQGEFEKIDLFCKSTPSKYLINCYSGVIESSVMSDPLVRKGVEICSLFDTKEANVCFDSIVARMKITNRSEKLNLICEVLKPTNKKTNCLESVKNAI